MAGRKWTKEKIVATIRELYEQGVDLSPTSIQKTHSALFSSARSKTHFGNWRSAIAAAGLDYEKIKRGGDVWEREDIIQGIQQGYEAGEDLLGAGFKEKNKKLYLAACAKRYFGSWRAAIEAAGLDYEELRGLRFWNKERIVQRLLELYEQGEKLVWSNIDRSHPDLYRAARRKENFGSWRRALAAAGLSYPEARSAASWTREEAVEAFRNVLTYRRDVSPEKMARDHPALWQTLLHYFGSWENAMAAVRPPTEGSAAPEEPD